MRLTGFRVTGLKAKGDESNRVAGSGVMRVTKLCAPGNKGRRVEGGGE